MLHCNQPSAEMFPSILLQGGETADYIGAVRVFGIGDKMLFEQLTSLDSREMTM